MKVLWMYTDVGWVAILPYHEPEPREKPGPKPHQASAPKEKERTCTRCKQPRKKIFYRYDHSTICTFCLNEYLKMIDPATR